MENSLIEKARAGRLFALAGLKSRQSNLISLDAHRSARAKPQPVFTTTRTEVAPQAAVFRIAA